MVQIGEAQLVRCETARRSLQEEGKLIDGLLQNDSNRSQELTLAAVRALDENGRKLAELEEERRAALDKLSRLKRQEKAVARARDAENGLEQQRSEAKSLVEITESWLARR